MVWYFHVARKQLFPSGRFFSFNALISMLGVSLGVMVLLIVQSVMNGFVHDIRTSLARTNGDVRIFSGGLIDSWKELQEWLEADEDIRAVAPFAQGVVLLQAENRPIFPFVWGLQVSDGPPILPVEDFLIAGELNDLDGRSVFLSHGVARQLGVHLGDAVEIYTPLMLDRMKYEEVLLPMEMLVAGIFETGWNEVDSNTVLVTLETMQELYGLEDRVHGMTVLLEEPDRATAVARRLNDTLPSPYFARTWMDMNQDFLFILQMEKTIMFFIMIFIVLVASFSIAISLMMSVLRKTREIGVFAAMGATRRQIGACFCLQGLLIGVIGTVVGVLGALLALHFREHILELFAHITGRGQALVDAYGFSYLPVHYVITDFIIVISFSIVISTLAGLIPAWRAARLQPAEALRNE